MNEYFVRQAEDFFLFAERVTKTSLIDVSSIALLRITKGAWNLREAIMTLALRPSIRKSMKHWRPLVLYN